MFEKLYSRQHAIRWHREGPLAREREGYLEALARQGVPLNTLRMRACYSLSVAKALAGMWAEDRPFALSELEKLAEAYARTLVAKGRTSKPDHPRACFLHESLQFLKFVGRPVPTPPTPGQRDLKELEHFIRACCHERGLSPHTEKVRRRDLLRFLRYLEGRGVELAQLTADHVDEFIKHLGQRWGRVSLKMVASTLRVFLRHAENRGWVRRGLANALLAPRIYGQEGLPLGPTWDEVARVAGNLEDQTRKFLRDRVAILLLSVYAMRSEEVRKLRIEDVD